MGCVAADAVTAECFTEQFPTKMAPQTRRLGFVEAGTDAQVYTTPYWYPPDNIKHRSASIDEH
jgi:hypothetical protein